MTDTDIDTAKTDEQKRHKRREEIVGGLRALADFLETNPEFELQTYIPSWYSVASDGDEFRQRARLLPGTKEKSIGYDKAPQVTKSFGGGIEVVVTVDREAICEQRVVDVVHHEATLREAYDEEIVEWDCPPWFKKETEEGGR